MKYYTPGPKLYDVFTFPLDMWEAVFKLLFLAFLSCKQVENVYTKPTASFMAEKETKLILSFNTQKDLLSANELLDELRSVNTVQILEDITTYTYNPSAQLQRLIDEVEKSQNKVKKRYLYSAAAGALARRGWIDQSLMVLSQSGTLGEQDGPAAYLKLAEAYHKANLDPLLMITKAKDLVDGEVTSDAVDFYAKRGNYIKFFNLLDIAKVEDQIGFSPLKTFEEAAILCESLEHNFHYNKLAKRLADCGLFNLAQIMAAKVRRTKDNRSAFDYLAETQLYIAKRQLEGGDLQGAIDTALSSKRDDVLSYTYALSTINEKRDILTTDQIEEYLQKAREYTEQVILADVQVDLYATIGRAEAVNNMHYTQSFARAWELASKEGDLDNRAYAYLDIAKNQALGAIDANSTFDLVLELSDTITQTPSPLLFDEERQVVLYQDIAEEAIEIGYFDKAKEAIEKIQPVWNLQKADLLVKLAKAKSRIGLSVEEIENLPPEYIKTVLLGNNDSAKEAVLYFGLDKKLG